MQPLSEAPVEPQGGDRNFVRSVGRGLRVVRAFSAEHPTLSVADLARLTGLSRPALRRVLLTLHELGLVGVAEKQYHLRPGVLDLGYRCVVQAGLPGLVQPHLDVLNADLQEACSLGILSEGRVVYLARAQARRFRTAVRVEGAQLPASATAIGRVLLSGLDDDSVRAHLREHPPVGWTPSARTSVEELVAEVREVRRRGFAVVHQEYVQGFHGAAVPLMGLDGEQVAAINVALPVSNHTVEEVRTVVAEKLLAAARRIERDMAVHPAWS